MAEKKDKKKFLTGALAIGLAAALAIGGGTYAYLADSTDEVVNTVEMNKSLVDITETTKDYQIIPGTSETKDPKVTMDNTVDSWLFVKVIDKTKDLVQWSIADGWTLLDGTDDIYYRAVKGDAKTKEFYILKDNKIYYSADLKNKDLTDDDGNLKDSVTLSFQGYTIQQAGFDSAYDAYYGAYYATFIDEDGNIVMDSDATVEDINMVLAHVDDGTNVVVNNSIESEDSITLPAGRTATLVLGDGVTITNTAGNTVDNYGDLTIKGGTFDSTAASVATINNHSGAKLTISDAVIKRSNTSSYYTVYNQGVMDVTGCTAEFARTIFYNKGASEDSPAELTINSGTYTTTGAKDTVNNSYNYSTLIVNGGTFNNTGGAKVLMNRAKAVINNGVFYSNSTYAIDNYCASPQTVAPDLTINQGRFTSEKKAAVRNYKSSSTTLIPTLTVAENPDLNGPYKGYYACFETGVTNAHAITTNCGGVYAKGGLYRSTTATENGWGIDKALLADGYKHTEHPLEFGNNPEALDPTWGRYVVVDAK